MAIYWQTRSLRKQLLQPVDREILVKPGPRLVAAREDSEIGVSTLVPGTRTEEDTERHPTGRASRYRDRRTRGRPHNHLLVGNHRRDLLHSASELTFWTVDQPEPLHSIKNGSGYDLSLHPDKRQLLVPTYATGGSSGNGGRGKTPENYLANTTVLRIFSLFAQPEKTEGEIK